MQPKHKYFYFLNYLLRSQQSCCYFNYHIYNPNHCTDTSLIRVLPYGALIFKLVAVYSLHNRKIACQCVTIIMQSCRCHSLVASRPCCHLIPFIHLIQFQCNMCCQCQRQFISCCFLWLYLTGKYISKTLMPSLFGTLLQGRVCDPGKEVIIAVIQMANWQFCQVPWILWVGELLNNSLGADHQLYASPVHLSIVQETDKDASDSGRQS